MAARAVYRAPEPLTDLARAKVNLFLHVLGRRPDGYHALQSLAVFPQIGDVVSAERHPIRALSLRGPFAPQLDGDGDNLVMRAAEALADATQTGEGVALTLDKRLPVASGIGGGSADAAATLRLLMRLWGRAPAADALDRIALALGADVPVCLGSAPAMMRGVGETLSPAPAMPGFWMVLVNPLRRLGAAEVFGALERADNPPAPDAPARFADFGHLVAWLSRQRNDLEAPALARRPVVASVLAALRWSADCRLARMSGSGATCFGLFETERAARAARQTIRDAEPGWWTAAAPVAPWTGDAGQDPANPADGGDETEEPQPAQRADD